MVGYAEAGEGQHRREADRIVAKPKPKPKKKRAPTKKRCGVRALRSRASQHHLQDVHAAAPAAGGCVFPVYETSWFGDTFGAPRGDIASARVAARTSSAAAARRCSPFPMFSVRHGRLRLWLRDHAGNEFYYAHLPLRRCVERDGQAGTVLGFMGNTGDAVSAPYRLPLRSTRSACSTLGYDGAVRRTPISRPGGGIDFAQVAAGAAAVLRDQQHANPARFSPDYISTADSTRIAPARPEADPDVGPLSAQGSGAYFQFSCRYSNSSAFAEDLF